MASAEWSEQAFGCPVCLEMLCDPATLPCGHTYCLTCIQSHWDRGEAKKVYSCPQCRQTFSPRPVLAKSTLLVEAMEKLKMRGREDNRVPAGAAMPSLPCAPLSDESGPWAHSSDSLYPKIHESLSRCSDHQLPLELFCCVDQVCICAVCQDHGHKGHQIVRPEEERRLKERELTRMHEDMERKILQKEAELQCLPHAARSYKTSSQALQRESRQIFAELTLSMEQLSTQVTEFLCSHEAAACTHTEGQIHRLEQEVAQLRGRDEELLRLTHIQDSICFLKNFLMLEAPLPNCEDPMAGARSEAALQGVRVALMELRDRLQELCKTSLAHIFKVLNDAALLAPEPSSSEPSVGETISEAVHPTQTPVAAVPPSEQRDLEPKTREELLKFRFEPTLDPNSAYRHLRLSEGDRKATLRAEKQAYPDHPDRFQYWRQVMCREPLAGSPYYWEMEWKGQKVTLGVAYKEMGRKGTDDSCRLGHNNQSWGLYWSGTSFSVWHSGKEMAIDGPKARRIGVYLDQQAGILVFYRISHNQAQPLYKIQTVFSGPLYPGFRFWSEVGASVTICDLE